MKNEPRYGYLKLTRAELDARVEALRKDEIERIYAAAMLRACEELPFSADPTAYNAAVERIAREIIIEEETAKEARGDE